MQTSAPSPAVEHLPTVLRKIRNGDYRVPAFQRDFVWEEKQVLELLESVYRGFPIGSILLWRVEGRVFNSEKDIPGFPQLPERYPTNFILDGVQRLTALSGSFSLDDVDPDRRFRIYFDLEREVFLHERDRSKSGVSIPINSVFLPRAFLTEQQRLASLPDSDVLLDRAVKLLATFQEYMIPLVTIERKQAREVVDIFQRVNSTGTPLGVVDFIRALTWSDDFDLTIELERVQAHFEQLGFTFSEEILLKSLGIVLGLKPLHNVLLLLREKDAETLRLGVRNLTFAFERAVSYVADGLGIAAAEALPYEAQWLLLIRSFQEGVDLKRFSSEMLPWLKASSLYETLQGRPDHALARMIDEMVDAMKSDVWPVEKFRQLDPTEMSSKRFVRGKATSVAFVEMLIENGLFARAGIQTPLSGVPYEEFYPILDRAELNSISRRHLNSARTIPNMFFAPSARLRARGAGASEFLAYFATLSVEEQQAFRTQFIDDAFISDLRHGRLEVALVNRAQAIEDFAKRWTT